jgi:hypothetical protein
MSVNPYEPSSIPEPFQTPAFEVPGEIEYEVTIDDLVAFNVDVVRYSKVNRILAVAICIAGMILLPLLSFLSFFTFEPEGENLSEGLLFMAIFLALMTAMTLWIAFRGPTAALTRLVVRVMLAASDLSGHLGPHWLRLTTTDILERNPKAEHRFPMTAVRKLVLDRDRLYIYVSSLSAIVVPARAFSHPRMIEAFAAAIGKHSAINVDYR